MQHNEKTLCPTTSLRNIKEITSVGVFIAAWIKLTLKGIKLAVGDCYGYNALDVFKKLKNNKNWRINNDQFIYKKLNKANKFEPLYFSFYIIIVKTILIIHGFGSALSKEPIRPTGSDESGS